MNQLIPMSEKYEMYKCMKKCTKMYEIYKICTRYVQKLENNWINSGCIKVDNFCKFVNF